MTSVLEVVKVPFKTSLDFGCLQDDENSFSKMVHDLADSLMRMGENLLEKAQEARNLLGSLLIRMGYHVHAAL